MTLSELSAWVEGVPDSLPEEMRPMAVRNRTTGVMHDLLRDGNTVILVDHDTHVLSEADWLIELGPEAGAGGSRIIAQGTPLEICSHKSSLTGKYLKQYMMNH